MFFEELEHLLSREDVSDAEKLQALAAVVDFNKTYAKQSGSI